VTNAAMPATTMHTTTDHQPSDSRVASRGVRPRPIPSPIGSPTRKLWARVGLWGDPSLGRSSSVFDTSPIGLSSPVGRRGRDNTLSTHPTAPAATARSAYKGAIRPRVSPRAPTRPGPSEQLIVWTLLDTGLRVGELCALTSKDILWQQRQLRVRGKGGPYGKKSKLRGVSSIGTENRLGY